MDIIDRILDLYYEINKINVGLFQLEMSGRINDKKIMELVEKLRVKVMDEHRLFLELEEEYPDIYKNIDDVLETDYSDMDEAYYMRFNDYIKLSNPVVDDENDILLDKLEDEEDYEGMNSEYLMKLDKLYKLCSNNLYLIYSSFLQESLDNLPVGDVREALFNLKYYGSFTNHDIEDRLILNNFNVKRDNFINLYFMADMIGMNLDEVDEVILDCVYNMIYFAVQKLLLIKDNDYRDMSNCAKSINCQCLMKAGVSLLSENDYKMVIPYIFDFVEMYSRRNNKISVEKIYEVIDNRNNLKGRVKKISKRPIED